MRRLNALTSSIIFLSCAISSVAADTKADDEIKSIPLRTHSLAPPYLDSDMTSRWWDFGGDTLIRADQYVRLASDVPSQSGYIFSKIPLTATNWEIEFEFSISGKGNLHGDGFAMWVVKDRAQQGSVFGGKDEFEGFGLFFDTYKNNRPGTVFPYVMGMMGDGKTQYDSANDGKANEIGGCSARGLRGASVPAKAKVTYFQDQYLDVKLQYRSTDAWTDCFTVKAGQGRDFKMPSTAYLGFTAHTGELSDNFDIVTVETRNLYQPVKAHTGMGAGRDKGYQGSSGSTTPKKTSGGSWTGLFFKVMLIPVVAAGGWYGWKEYKRRQRRNGKYGML